MSVRLQTAEQAAADVGARVQQAEQAASAAADQAAAAQRQQMAAGGHSITTRLFKACLGGANPDAGAALDTAGIRDQPIAMADLPPIEQKQFRQVYVALCLQVSGVAMTKLQNMEVHNGLEAWRQLPLEFEPRTAGRRRLHLTNLLRPAKTNEMEKLGDTIEQWEREVRDYERAPLSWRPTKKPRSDWHQTQMCQCHWKVKKDLAKEWWPRS
eukprot:1458932-Amphidinium_carterae.1